MRIGEFADYERSRTKTQKNMVYLPTIRQLTCSGFCSGVPFWNFPERQREWISRARLIIGVCIFGRVGSLLWRLGRITSREMS